MREHSHSHDHSAFQQCISPACGATYAIDEIRVACDRCGNLLDVAYDWDRLPRARVAGRLRAEVGAAQRSALLQRRVAVPRPAAVRPARAVRHRRRRADAAARRPTAWPATSACSPAGCSAVRGDESLGQFQRQRHVGRLHPRPHRRRHAGRLRLDRQHQRLAGPVLLGHAADEGRDLHRLGQDLLRQALAGARLRCADRADRRRLRRRHGPRPGSLQATGHLPGQQRQSLPAGRAEDDHVPRAGSAALGSARLDRRARRKPGQLQRLRQGVSRTARAGPDRPHAAAGRDQRRRRQHALRAGTSSAGCAGTTASRDMDIADALLRRDGRRSSAAPRPSPAPSRSTGR